MKTKDLVFPALICAVALATTGCTSLDEALARPAPYQKYQGTGSGYASVQLQANVFRVSFVADPKADGQRVADFALLQAAELALDHHFASFVVRHQFARALPLGRTADEIGMHPDFAQYPVLGAGPVNGIGRDAGAPQTPEPKATANVKTLVIECSVAARPEDPDRQLYDAGKTVRELRAKYALTG